MDTNLEIAVIKLTQRQGIVEILSVSRVYRESQDFPEILTAFQIFLSNLLGDSVSGVLNLRREPVRKAIFGEDGMHFGIVLARFS